VKGLSAKLGINERVENPAAVGRLDHYLPGYRISGQ